MYFIGKIKEDQNKMKDKVVKSEIVKRVVEKLKGTKINIGGNKHSYKREYNLKYTQEIVDNVICGFLDVIVDIIENGDSVKLNSYMILEPKYYTEKRARNVYEDKEITMPAQYRVKLNVGTKLEEACKRLSERELERDIQDIESV